jgi:formamidopyrimidine-DNA glycosylase
MPELPDIILYQRALERQIVGRPLISLTIRSPFVLRTFEVSPESLHGRTIKAIERLGKRIVLCFDDDIFLVIHLMIAGRFHWRDKSVLPKGKNDLAAFALEHGTLLLTEASSKKRAGMWIVQSRMAVQALHTPGLNVLDSSLVDFQRVLLRSNNTLKRALADPTRFDGIGNAYSDEILHAAKISPLKLTLKLEEEEIERLWNSCKQILQLWIDRLQGELGTRFPEKVTAFRPEMAVHGKFGSPCPICQAPIQRIRYAENECNYCPRCQTGDRILADRSMSRLLKDDWPRTLEELEEGRGN